MAQQQPLVRVLSLLRQYVVVFLVAEVGQDAEFLDLGFDVSQLFQRFFAGGETHVRVAYFYDFGAVVGTDQLHISTREFYVVSTLPERILLVHAIAA